MALCSPAIGQGPAGRRSEPRRSASAGAAGTSRSRPGAASSRAARPWSPPRPACSRRAASASIRRCPRAKQEALAAVPLGAANKVAIGFGARPLRPGGLLSPAHRAPEPAGVPVRVPLLRSRPRARLPCRSVRRRAGGRRGRRYGGLRRGPIGRGVRHGPAQARARRRDHGLVWRCGDPGRLFLRAPRARPISAAGSPSLWPSASSSRAKPARSTAYGTVHGAALTGTATAEAIASELQRPRRRRCDPRRPGLNAERQRSDGWPSG